MKSLTKFKNFLKKLQKKVHESERMDAQIYGDLEEFLEEIEE